MKEDARDYLKSGKLNEFWGCILSSENNPETDELLKSILDEMPSDEFLGVEAQDYASMSSGMKFTSNRSWRKLVTGFFYGMAAAAVFVSVFLGISLRNQSEIYWSEVSTAVGQTMDVALPDGSTFNLGPNSFIAYPSRFSGKNRTVIFRGSAYADITHLENDIPFIIEMGEIETVVTGTEFYLDVQNRCETALVSLVEGSLLVRKKNEPQGISLSSGQQAVYNRGKDEFTRKSFDAKAFSNHLAEGNIVYFDRTLYDIAIDLENRFGDNIVFGNINSRDFKYFAIFSNDENSEQILRALSSDGSFAFKNDLNGNILITNN